MRRSPTRWPVAVRVLRAYGWLAILALALLVVGITMSPVGAR